jgi:hypothetical protein
VCGMEDEWLDILMAAVASDPKQLGGYKLEYPNGVTQSAMTEAERKLGFEIPKELRSLLLEFDGVHEYTIDKSEKLQVGSIIWRLADMVDWHLSWTVREKRKLFCFSSSVLGNCFGYLLENGKPKDNEIWQSDHESRPPDERITRIAFNLREFISSVLAEYRWH